MKKRLLVWLQQFWNSAPSKCVSRSLRMGLTVTSKLGKFHNQVSLRAVRQGGGGGLITRMILDLLVLHSNKMLPRRREDSGASERRLTLCASPGSALFVRRKRRPLVTRENTHRSTVMRHQSISTCQSLLLKWVHIFFVLISGYLSLWRVEREVEISRNNQGNITGYSGLKIRRETLRTWAQTD